MSSCDFLSGLSSTHFCASLLTGLVAYVSSIHLRFRTTLLAIARAWSALSRRPLVNLTEGCAFFSA
jgi:hypothetical protein